MKILGFIGCERSVISECPSDHATVELTDDILGLVNATKKEIGPQVPHTRANRILDALNELNDKTHIFPECKKGHQQFLNGTLLFKYDDKD